MMHVTTQDTDVDGWQSANHSIPLARRHQAAFHVMLASKPGSGGQFRGYVPSLDLERGKQAEQETGTLRNFSTAHASP